MSRDPVDNPFGPKTRRRFVPWILGGLVLLLLFIMVSQQLWLWNVVRPDTASDTLVLYSLSTLNFVAFIVFLFIFIRSLIKLRRERRERELGSKIKTRLLVYFISLSFLPIAAMAAFSYLFLNRSLEKWFPPFSEGLVAEAEDLEREAANAQVQNVHDIAAVLALALNSQTESNWQATLDQTVAAAKLSEAEVITSDGEVRFRSEAALSDSDQLLLEGLLRQARQAGGKIGESLADAKGFDVVAVPLNNNLTLLVSPAKRGEASIGARTLEY